MRKMTRALAERRMRDVGKCFARIDGKLARYPDHPDADVMRQRLKEYVFALKSYKLEIERFDMQEGR